MVEFGFMTVGHRYLNEIGVLILALSGEGKGGGRDTLALLASWRCLS